MYSTSRAQANVAAGFGMREKLLGGNGGGFQHTGFGDPGSPMGYSATAGVQYKLTALLHNGICTHHEAPATIGRFRVAVGGLSRSHVLTNHARYVMAIHEYRTFRKELPTKISNQQLIVPTTYVSLVQIINPVFLYSFIWLG